MKKIFLVLIMLSVLAAGFSGCAVTEPAETTGPLPETTAPDPILSAPDQSVNTLFALPYCYNENGVFNPILAHSDICAPLFSLLYDGLFATDSNGEAVPRLAAEMTAEGTTVTIKLRDDATFHDGTRVDSDDVLWSYKMAKENQNSRYAGRLSNITGVTSPDKNTVVLTLETPQGSLAYCLDVPIIKNGTGVYSNAVGSGRYRIIEQAESMYLMANESWYARPADSSFPIDLIILTYVDGLDDLVYSMVSGNSNLVRLDPFIFSDKKISGNSDTYKILSRDFLYFAFNTSYYAPTSSESLRKALAACIDLPEILETCYQGVVYSDGLFPESVTQKPAQAPSEASTAAAARLMRVAGYRYLAEGWIDSEGNALELTIICGRDTAKQAAAAVIEKNLTDLGILCTVKTVGNVSEALKSGNFDIAVCETTLSPDYDFRYLLAYEGEENFNQFAIPDIEGPLSDFFAQGHINNAQTAEKINSAIKNSMPIIPVGYKEDTVCLSREFAFGNVRVAADDPFSNIFDWVRYR